MADLLVAATLSSMELLHATAHTLVRSINFSSAVRSPKRSRFF